MSRDMDPLVAAAEMRAMELCNEGNANPLKIEVWRQHTAFSCLCRVLLDNHKRADLIMNEYPFAEVETHNAVQAMLLPKQVDPLAVAIDQILMTENAFATGETLAELLRARFNITIEEKGNG